MVNKCKTCGDKIGYFSPSQEYCSIQCEQSVEKKKPTFEDLFWNLLNKKK